MCNCPLPIAMLLFSVFIKFSICDDVAVFIIVKGRVIKDEKNFVLSVFAIVSAKNKILIQYTKS